jgi:hypothetical protein
LGKQARFGKIRRRASTAMRADQDLYSARTR